MAKAEETMDQAIKVMADREGKYLTFSMASEEYGIGILKIKEIIGMMSITTVPQTPEFIKGVINLRSKVIPVIDLRLRFGMTANDYTERTCIIVVEIPGLSGTVMIGIVVDSVSEVLSVISVHRLDECTTPECCCGERMLQGSLKVIHG